MLVKGLCHGQIFTDRFGVLIRVRHWNPQGAKAGALLIDRERNLSIMINYLRT